MPFQVLFENNIPIRPQEVSQAVFGFGQSYTKTVSTIIRNTDCADLDKKIFFVPATYS